MRPDIKPERRARCFQRILVFSSEDAAIDGRNLARALRRVGLADMAAAEFDEASPLREIKNVLFVQKEGAISASDLRQRLAVGL